MSQCHYRRLEPSKFRGLVTAKVSAGRASQTPSVSSNSWIPSPRSLRLSQTRKGAWTHEEDAAMFKGVDDYGLDFARIKEENKAVLESRKPKAMEQRYRRIKKQKYKELKKKEVRSFVRFLAPRIVILNSSSSFFSCKL